MSLQTGTPAYHRPCRPCCRIAHTIYNPIVHVTESKSELLEQLQVLFAWPPDKTQLGALQECSVDDARQMREQRIAELFKKGSSYPIMTNRTGVFRALKALPKQTTAEGMQTVIERAQRLPCMTGAKTLRLRNIRTRAFVFEAEVCFSKLVLLHVSPTASVNWTRIPVMRSQAHLALGFVQDGMKTTVGVRSMFSRAILPQWVQQMRASDAPPAGAPGAGPARKKSKNRSQLDTETEKRRDALAGLKPDLFLAQEERAAAVSRRASRSGDGSGAAPIVRPPFLYLKTATSRADREKMEPTWAEAGMGHLFPLFHPPNGKKPFHFKQCASGSPLSRALC